MVLVDAGPLIALIHKDDEHHERCVAVLRSLSEPLGTVDAALVAMAEREKVRRIFALERRDFEVYRPTRLGRFILLPG